MVRLLTTDTHALDADYILHEPVVFKENLSHHEIQRGRISPETDFERGG